MILNSKERKKLTSNNRHLIKVKYKSVDEENDLAEKIFNTVREPLLLLDSELRVVKASSSFYNLFMITSNKTLGKHIYELGNRQWDIPKLRDLLEKILPEKTTFENYEVEHDFNKIGRRVMLLNARKIQRGVLEEQMILLAIEDITERKNKEDLLNERNRLTKEYLDILLDFANVPMIIWNSSREITQINKNFESLSGYKLSELRNKKIEFLFPKDEIDSSLNMIKNILHKGDLGVIEVDILTKGKNRKTVIWNSTNILDKEEEGVVTTIALDITSRKQAEERLTVLEARYRRLFESARDGILILDAETGMIVDVNPFLIELLGYSKKDFLEKELWEIGVFKDIAANKDKFLELQKNKYVRYEDLSLETADGQKIHVEFVSNVYLVNNKKVIQCSIRDITERKKAERKVHESEKRFRTIFNQAPIGIALLDMQGHPLISNSRLSKMVGYSNDELSKMNFSEFTHPEDIAKDVSQFNELVEGKIYKYFMEKRLVHKNGNPVWVNLFVTMLRDENGIPLEILGMVEDISKRKEIENRIKFQSDLLFNVGQAVIAVDLEGKVIYWNNAAEKIYGWTSTEAMGRKIVDLTPAEQTKKIMEKLSEGNSWAGEFLVKRKDGSSFPAYVTDAPINDSKGKLIGIIGISSDITERKLAETEITMLAHSLRSVNECVSVTDMESNILFVNTAFLKTYGYTENEIIGKNISVVRSQNNDQEFVAEIMPATIRGEWTGELWNRRKDGSEFPIYLSTNVIKDKDGKSLGLIGVATDITERRHSEETLAKLFSAVEQTVDSIMITNRDGIIEYVNHAFEELTGFSAEEAIGKTSRIIKSGTNDQKYYESMWETILSGKLFRTEILNKKKNGDLYYEEKSITPIFDKNKKITHFVGTGLDITDRKHAEKELIKAKERAEESDKLKSEFLSQMSHEIRTPINIILGNVDYLKDSYSEKMDSDSQDCFNGIDLASKRIIRTIDLVLNAAELQTAGYKPHFVIVDLDSDILSKLYKEHLQSANHKGLELIYKREVTGAKVLADEYSLTQIFINLIDNAVKYTIKGRVEILLGKNKADEIIVEIKDTGIGMSKEFLLKIFTPFTQEEHGYSRSYDGNGLGLSLVNNYCDINKVLIEVESEKNIGSTFRVIFNRKDSVRVK